MRSKTGQMSFFELMNELFFNPDWQQWAAGILGRFTRSFNGKNQVGILENFLFHYYTGWCRLRPPS